MEGNVVIGIELATLKELIAATVREEVTKIVSSIKDNQTETNPFVDRLFTKDVAALLGVTRQTVLAYRKKGILPEPQQSASGKPYWTRNEVTAGIKSHDLAFKYNL